jgi:hypothetical protein
VKRADEVQVFLAFCLKKYSIRHMNVRRTVRVRTVVVRDW